MPMRLSRQTARAFVELAVATALFLVAPGHARAQDRGVQVSPDEHLLLVTKDVPEKNPVERWAITFNPATGIATGNAFPLGGGAPQFIWCRTNSASLAPNPNLNQYVLDCFGAPACSALPCPKTGTGVGWSHIGEVTIGGDFFLPPS
jgi:hypothetical protein